VLCSIVAPAAPMAAASAQELRARGGVEIQARGFLSAPAAPAQTRHDASAALTGMFAVSWDRGTHVVTFEPFARVDAADRRRSHVDVRVLSYELAWRDVELRLGVRRVFWGVTESRHLVDVLNQTDLVEDPDGEDKLGQPMANIAWISGLGTVDGYLLVGFRQPTFPGEVGRLRTPLVVDPDRAVFARSGVARHLAWAARWAHVLGPLDIAVSHFSGLSREPRLEPDLRDTRQLIPYYDRVHQTGIEAQIVSGNWAWKVEALSRSGGPGGRIRAAVGGFEYTLYQVFGTDADLGLLAEVLQDTRDDVPFDDDLFAGVRLARNDVHGTELLAGALVDRTSGGTLASIEASRRIGDAWSIEVEIRGFMALRAADPMAALRKDDYLGLRITRWF
jgi:hypothetical protein